MSYHQHEYTEVIEDGYTRYWSLVDNGDGTVDLYHDEFSEDGNGSLWKACGICGHTVPLDTDTVINWN